MVFSFIHTADWQLGKSFGQFPPETAGALRAEPVEIEPSVFILPAPWARIQHGEDLTAWMAGCETPKGALRIGLAHGGVRGFGSDAQDGREIIPPDRAQSARLDYLALGDWHARAEISPRCFYPGTPEPDRHKSGARGQALAVTIEAGKTPKIVDIPTANYDWPQVSLTLEPDGAAESGGTIQ